MHYAYPDSAAQNSTVRCVVIPEEVWMLLPFIAVLLSKLLRTATLGDASFPWPVTIGCRMGNVVLNQYARGRG